MPAHRTSRQIKRRLIQVTMTQSQTRLQQVIEILQEAHRIAATTDLDSLLAGLLDLFVKVTGGDAGRLFLYDIEAGELVCSAACGVRVMEHSGRRRVALSACSAGAALRQRVPLLLDSAVLPADLTGNGIVSLYYVPLLLRDQPVGAVELFNVPVAEVQKADERVVLDLLCSRLVTEVEKARLLASAERRERRHQALVEIIHEITTTLERDELLDRILEQARDLLAVEATSIWLRDPQKDGRGDLVLHMATGHRREHMTAHRVPAGQGIIGHVVASGQPVMVNDVRADPRFYSRIDEQTGFVTRSIVCVPLHAPGIRLGGERGAIRGSVIGGAQALNKLDGRPFTVEDLEIFETLARQAATVIQFSQIYQEADMLGSRIIDAITGAIDLKDPYTRGHSQRVADYSVEIARELAQERGEELPPERIYQIRIASKLHDVGKIRVPDRVLKKRGPLNEREIRQMRRHTTYGVEFLADSKLLELELLQEAVAALSDHHERLNGQGYPRGKRKGEISATGLIVAVADVFDALTSARPYRKAMSAEEALVLLQQGAGSEYDADCVQALLRARRAGRIVTQVERDRASGGSPLR